MAKSGTTPQLGGFPEHSIDRLDQVLPFRGLLV
jgi:hypothetical protein